MNTLNKKSLEHVYGMLNTTSQHQMRLVSKAFSEQLKTGHAFKQRLMFLMHRLNTDQVLMPGELRYIVITLLVRKPGPALSSIRLRRPLLFRVERNMQTGSWSGAFAGEKDVQPRKTDLFARSLASHRRSWRRRRRHEPRKPRVKAPKPHIPPYASESDEQFLTMVVRRPFEFSNAELPTAVGKIMEVFKYWGAEKIQAFKQLPNMLPYSDPTYTRPNWGAEGLRSMHWQAEGNANAVRLLRNHNIFDNRPQVVWPNEALTAARARLGAGLQLVRGPRGKQSEAVYWLRQ